MSYVSLAVAYRYGSEIRAYLGEFESGGSLVAVMAHKRIQSLINLEALKKMNPLSFYVE